MLRPTASSTSPSSLRFGRLRLSLARFFFAVDEDAKEKSGGQNLRMGRLMGTILVVLGLMWLLFTSSTHQRPSLISSSLLHSFSFLSQRSHASDPIDFALDLASRDPKNYNTMPFDLVQLAKLSEKQCTIIHANGDWLEFDGGKKPEERLLTVFHKAWKNVAIEEYDRLVEHKSEVYPNGFPADVAPSDSNWRLQMIDVGCNKFSYSYAFIQDFAHAAKLCKETTERHKQGKGKAPLPDLCYHRLSVACIEPNPMTIANSRLRVQPSGDLYENVVSWYGYRPSDEELSISFHKMAVADKPGKLTFYYDYPGDEHASLRERPSAHQESSEVVTVDAFLEREGLDEIQWLKTDGEGFDPLFIEGAVESLKAGKIRYWLFEYHGLWTRIPNYDPERHSLRAIAKLFDRHGYDTYFVGEKNLYLIREETWCSGMDHDRWSNGFAVRRGAETIPLMKEIFLIFNTNMTYSDYGFTRY